MRKKTVLILLNLLLTVSLFSGCVSNATDKDFQTGDVLYQVSTINSLIGGNYDGFISIGDLKNNGNIGIGTFHALDGEMVMIDNKVYKVKASGKVEEVEDTAKTPFAAVTYFDKDISEELLSIDNYESLQKELNKLIEYKESFYAFQINGTFDYIKTRSVPKQSKPYTLLSEVTKNQPTFEYNDVKGSLVGFWCPEYVGGINVAGYHLHFISDDKTKGGHLLDISFKKVQVSADITNSFNMNLSKNSNAKSIKDIEAEIEKVEK